MIKIKKRFVVVSCIMSSLGVIIAAVPFISSCTSENVDPYKNAILVMNPPNCVTTVSDFGSVLSMSLSFEVDTKKGKNVTQKALKGQSWFYNGVSLTPDELICNIQASEISSSFNLIINTQQKWEIDFSNGIPISVVCDISGSGTGIYVNGQCATKFKPSLLTFTGTCTC